MASSVFYYYLPAVAPDVVDTDYLRAAGLEPALWDVIGDPKRCKPQACKRGPDGKAGTIIWAQPANGDGAECPRYDAERQTWQAFRNGSLWVGYLTDNKPTPASLQRLEPLEGYPHKFSDGHSWVCPIIRRCYVAAIVPQRYAISSDGQTVGTVLPPYRDAWRLSAGWFAADLTIAERVEAAGVALGLAYRVSKIELGLLGILDDSSIETILDSALDVPWFLEAMGDVKKKRLVLEVQASLENSAASQTAVLATLQAMQTCDSSGSGSSTARKSCSEGADPISQEQAQPGANQSSPLEYSGEETFGDGISDVLHSGNHS